jgi:hypothetical protein
VIETTGRTYAAPWTDEDRAIIWGRRTTWKFTECYDRGAWNVVGGDRADADLMLALTAEAPSPTGPAPTEGSPAPER